MARLDVKTQDPERYAQVKAEQEELKLQFSMAAFGTSVARLCPYCEHMTGVNTVTQIIRTMRRNEQQEVKENE